MYKYVWFAFIMILLSCKQGKQTKPILIKQVPLSDSLVTLLYKNFKPNPQNTEEKDENALIDYAVNNNLNVTRSASGLYYQVLTKGTGGVISPFESLSVDYRGTFINGEEFDSSYKRGKPINFSLGQVIEGWNEGLSYLHHGDHAILLIPSYLAYGNRGSHGLVPPDTPLVFEMQVH